MSKVKAIQTAYKGYKFRSRLEARWGVFFDAVGIEWEYEPEGFEFSTGKRYLPDFYLPEFSAWVEIKPKGGSKKPVFSDLKQMIEDGIAGKHKAWGFFGDPLDHHWMLPIYSSDVSKNKNKGWSEEWGKDTAFCLEKDDEGELFFCPTFSLTSFDKLKNSDSMCSNLKASELISNYKEKIKARSARFEFGETPE